VIWKHSSGSSRLLLAAALVSLGGMTAVVTGTSSAAAQGNDDWATFGHDPMHSGVSPDTTITAGNAQNLTTVWSTQIGASPSPILASPAVVYNATLGVTLVYEITSAGLVEALDATTGTVEWQTQLPYGVIGGKLGNGDEASPAVYGNTVYLGTTGALEALDATTGAIECSFPVPIETGNQAIINASPVVGNVDGKGPTVFFGNVALHKNPNIGHFWAVTGVGNTAGACQLKWKLANFNHGSWDEPGLAQLSDGTWVVVFGSANPDDSVYAVNAQTGAELWRFQTAYTGTPYHQRDEDVGGGPTFGAPGVNGFADGVVYIIGKDGIEYALDFATGQEIWSLDLNAYLGTSFYDSDADAALVGNTIYESFNGRVLALNATTGAVVWVKQLHANGIWASPTVAGPTGEQVLFVGTTGGQECVLRLSDGKVLFRSSIADKIYSSTSLSDGMAFFGAVNGSVYALGF
jgi:outer membrane protein assembly factor BamB